MLWSCRDCGHEVAASDPVLATTIGWTDLDGDTGLCPICSEKHGACMRSALVARSRSRIDASRAQLAISREMIRKMRGVP
jgi:hypothetical protein